jgi:hypothetical protein
MMAEDTKMGVPVGFVKQRRLIALNAPACAGQQRPDSGDRDPNTCTM